MKVNIEDFFAKYGGEEYRNGLFIPEDIHALRFESFLSGDTEFDVPDNIDAVIEANKLKQEKRDAEYNNISLHRKAGMECEANGDVDEAINEYAESIRLGENAENDMFHAFGYSYTRIIVLLDKVKRFAEEIDYIEAVLNHSMKDSERGKYAARLEKTKVKLVKQSNDGRI